MTKPDFTSWTDAQLKQTPDFIIGKFIPERDAELERRKNIPSDGSEQRVARLVKTNRKRK